MRVLKCVGRRPVPLLGFAAGRLVAGGSRGYDIFDLAAGESRHLPENGTVIPNASSFAVDPRGRWFYTSDGNHGCRVLPLDEAGPGGFPVDPSECHTAALAASPDGTRVAASRSANRVECWHVAVPWRLAWALRDGEKCDLGRIWSEGKGWYTSALAFSPDGRRIGLVERRYDSRRGRPFSHILIRDAATGALVAEAAVGDIGWYVTLRFLADSRRVALLTPDFLDVWDPAGAGLVVRLDKRKSAFRAVAIHPSGRLIGLAGRTAVQLLHPETLGELRSFNWQIGELHSLAFNEDGMLGAAGGTGGQINLWDIDD
jgi:hypothetical protein